MEHLLTVENGIALLTLATLEIVLGIDNIVFLSILTGKLPPEKRPMARKLGLGLALVARIGLLLAIGWLTKLTKPLFNIPTFGLVEHAVEISGKDLVMLIGGLFLMFKSVKEIHHKMEGGESPAGKTPDPARGLGKVALSGILAQIVLVDIVFSLDSVITAVGMAKEIAVMVAAVVIAVMVMLVLAGPIASFVEKHPTVKMLALAFLLLIGFTLIAEGLHQHVPKGYVYFAMAFSLGVEVLNLRVSARRAKGQAAH
jgi:predicted tellurium resistance membrane protein TerC